MKKSERYSLTKAYFKIHQMTKELLIDQLFDRLDDWRNLPAYQLERRSDIFFSLYLKDIIQSNYQQKVEHIIPEFPVKGVI